MNWCRSLLSSSVTTSSKVTLKPEQIAEDTESETLFNALRRSESDYAAIAPKKHRKKPAKRPKLDQSERATDSYINVFIDVDGEAEMQAIKTKLQNMCKAISATDTEGLCQVEVPRSANSLFATIPVSFLEELEGDDDITFVHPAESLKFSIPTATAAKQTKKPSFRLSKEHQYGEDVIIGIIDVGGFDFTHSDFLDENGETRFISIWDQGGSLRPPPVGFSRGSEYTEAHLKDAMRQEAAGDLPAHALVPQSQQTRGSHGTHVASIAAGNRGICRNAKIAAVIIDIPTPSNDYERRRTTFSDSSQIIRAVDYLVGLAKAEAAKKADANSKTPISINISLGTNGGGHDGSGGVTRWLDNAMQVPGRCISIASGNAGQEKGKDDDDIGWIMGRIHSSGRIASRGLDTELEWVVVGDGIEDLSENELEIWYSAQDRFIIELTPPNETKPIRVEPQEFVENKPLTDGTRVSIYNELYHPANGVNAISIYLSPYYVLDDLRGVHAGVWKIRLIGEEIRNGEFHCWIERDDPGEIGRTPTAKKMHFPSFFSESSNVDSHSISSLACGNATIAVANYDKQSNKMNITSAQGPTRDNRYKPDIAAPGTNIIAANGFCGQGDPEWISMSGTSMASPYVAGVIGLMLGANPDLTARQCMGILQRTSVPLPGQTYEWSNDSGFGRIDANQAINEAHSFTTRTQR